MSKRFVILLIAVASFTFSLHADEVRLRVISPQGTPLANLPVTLTESRGVWFNLENEPPREVSTDAEGRVVFESKHSLATATTPATDATKSRLQARVQVSGFALATPYLRPGDNELRLRPGKTWTGVVFDQEQKPVEGAELTLSVHHESSDQTWRLQSAASATVSTDAQGAWSFEHLPPSGQINIYVKHPRFRHESFGLDVSGATAPPLFLSPGAGVKGRLLTPDGKGIPGLSIYAGGGLFSRDENRTDAEGRFEILGLEPGEVYLQSFGSRGEEDSPPFIVPQQRVTLRASETLDVGDWQAKKGIEVRGQVVAASNKKPIEGARVSQMNQHVTTGADGRFVLHAEDPRWISIRADGFVTASRNNVREKNGVVDLGVVELKRGQKIEGVLLGTDEKPLANRSLQAQPRRGGNSEWARTDRDGKFSFDALEPGDYLVTSDGLKFASGAEFSVRDPQGQALGALANAPLRVVADAQASDARELARGRIVDGRGEPVAGAKIEIKFARGRSWSNQRSLSDSEGRFQAQAWENATPKIETVSRPGYGTFRAGEAKIEGDAWNLGDIVLQAKGAALRGRVVDANGSGVADAHVSILEDDAAPVVKTDASGTFSLPDVALEGVTLVASTGERWGQTRLENAVESVVVTLQSPPAVNRAALADELWQTAHLDWQWEQQWNTVGSRRIEAALGRLKPNVKNWYWERFLRVLAAREPQNFLSRASELYAATPTSLRPDFEATLALARARSNEPSECAKAQTWLDARKSERANIADLKVELLLHRALVARALKDSSETTLFDMANQLAFAANAKTRLDNADEWGGAAVALGANALGALLEDWEPLARFSAYLNAARRARAAGDLELAGRLLERARELVEAADEDAEKREAKIEGFPRRARNELAWAQNEYALKLAESNPEAALKLLPADEDREYEKLQLLIAAGRAAAKQGKTELATRALTQVFDARLGNVEFSAQAAEIALGYDTKLAEAWFEKALAKARPKRERSGFASIAPYALARRSVAPGESRIRLEREWQLRLAKVEEEQDDEMRANDYAALVTAMAHLDPNRAVEMLEKVPTVQNVRDRTRGEIAAVLLDAKS